MNSPRLRPWPPARPGGTARRRPWTRAGTDDAEEAFLETPEAEALTALGHTFTEITPLNKNIGAATAILFNADGTVTAVAEPKRRNGGCALVVWP